MSLLTLTVALVALQRLSEVILSAVNTKRLKALGAVEIAPKHYPLFILIHTLWLVAVLFGAPADGAVSWPLLIVFIGLQIGRVWVIYTLGRYWTTRIITLPHAPLIKKGPYRFTRHPNYLIVTLEIAVLPLAFGEVAVAIFFSIAHALLLAWRIKQEEKALKPRER